MAGIDRDVLPAPAELGAEMHALMTELYPICRSLTGDGVRATLEILGRELPLEVTEVPSGTPIFDWTAPNEWNVRDAWIADQDGTRVVDFRRCNLHVLGYSVPIRGTFSLAELREHLHTHPDEPDRIPFRTSYYDENWGFCLSRVQFDGLADGEYEVCIDSTLAPGSVTYAESVVPGRTSDEFLVSTYICHPSLANDNLSGIVLAATLAKYLARLPLRHTFRFLFAPGTIGPLAWLAANEQRLDGIAHGLVASCVGDPGPMTYKRSRRGTAEIDRAVETALRDAGEEHRVVDFEPWGGDERQFCSPAFDLPVGSLTRTPAGAYPEYHSSADDLAFVRPEALAASFSRYLDVFDIVESNARYVNLSPKGEPQLGRRGLYRSIAGGASREAALLWVLNQSDGTASLLDIAIRSGLPFRTIREAANALRTHDLLAEAVS
jgi:aminopeptidase-like protein